MSVREPFSWSSVHNGQRCSDAVVRCHPSSEPAKMAGSVSSGAVAPPWSRPSQDTVELPRGLSSSPGRGKGTAVVRPRLDRAAMLRVPAPKTACHFARARFLGAGQSNGVARAWLLPYLLPLAVYASRAATRTAASTSRKQLVRQGCCHPIMFRCCSILVPRLTHSCPLPDC